MSARRLMLPVRAAALAALFCAAAWSQPSLTLTLSDCDDAAAWTGGELVREPVRQGSGAIRWRLAEPQSLGLKQTPGDWSQFNALVFELYSERATGSPIWVIATSENPEQDGPDYYCVTLKLDFEGWQRIVLPFDEIRPVRHPLGWHSIGRFYLHSAWDPRIQVDPQAVVVVDDVRLVHLSDKGPRMTDEEFFEALDLTRPGLERVAAAVAAGDLAGAKTAWAQYLRTRERPRWFTDWRDRPQQPTPARVSTAAKLALEHKMAWQNKTFYLGEDIDWSQNQMTEGESATIEWNAYLNRHMSFKALGEAWFYTGERQYSDKLVELMVDWIEDAPVLLHSSGNSPYHWAWETLNTAVRTSDTWPDALFRTLDAPSWTDEALVMVTKSFAEHARHLMRYPTSRNWLTAEATGLFYTGVLFPEYREAEQWRRTALERLYRQMDTEVYPDGFEDELALGYGMWVMRNYGAVLDLAVLNDRQSEIPEDWLAKIEAMYNYVLYITMPNGIAPGLNDSGNTEARPILEKGFGYFPHRTDLQWVATGGAAGTPPQHTSYAFPYTGHYIMRSGWAPEDRYLLFDAGPFGSGHQHEDKLTIVLYAHGRLQVVDAGNYMYDASRWRRYVLSTRGHNTVMVDGLDQRRRKVRETWVLPQPFQPLDNPWISERDFDFVQGVYDNGYGYDQDLKVTHTRSILFVKPNYWIIVDRMQPPDNSSHRYESLFHLDAPEAVVGEDLSVTSVPPAGQSRLAILPLPTAGLQASVVKGKEDEPVQGWSWATGGPRGAIPTAIYSIEGSGERDLCYLLWPLAAGEEMPVASLRRLDSDRPGVVAGEIRLRDGSRHLFAFAPDAGRMRFAALETDAQVAFVALDAGGNVTSQFLVQGSYLRPTGP